MKKSDSKNKKNKKKTAPLEEHSTKQPNLKHKAAMPTDKEKDKPTIYPCKLYAKDHMTWCCPHLQECIEYLAKKDIGKAPIFLRNPFTTQQQQNLIANQPQPLQGGNDGSQHPSSGEGYSAIYTFETIEIATRAKSYEAPVAPAAETSSSQNPPLPNNFHIGRLV